MLVVAQKSGIVWGLDPDQKGKVVWQTRVGSGGMLGGIEWGHGADESNAYVAVSDRIPTPGAEAKPGISAVKLATGEKVWTTPAPKAACASMACNPAQSAPVAVIPGIVFSGSGDGQFRAYSTGTGAIVWEFNTAVPFETVNKVQATGGSIDAAGPVIANGMVLTPSGYAQWGGKAGNVLLAFTVDGK
jgi:polyvinyl alcohol dehydrogenase (cytochrome)